MNVPIISSMSRTTMNTAMRTPSAVTVIFQNCSSTLPERVNSMFSIAVMMMIIRMGFRPENRDFSPIRETATQRANTTITTA